MLLDKQARAEIAKDAGIISKISLNGDKIAFCIKYDLFARQKA